MCCAWLRGKVRTMTTERHQQRKGLDHSGLCGRLHHWGCSTVEACEPVPETKQYQEEMGLWWILAALAGSKALVAAKGALAAEPYTPAAQRQPRFRASMIFKKPVTMDTAAHREQQLQNFIRWSVVLHPAS
jgi:hypothetical protein